MTRWFRFYDDAVNDPKVQRLSGDKFKTWVNLLCLASKNDGVLPSLKDIAFMLRMSDEKVSAVLNELCEHGLIDPVEVSGAPMSYTPHNWDGRQFKSDVSNERVKRYRERKCTVTSTVTVTPPETETETETETDKNTCAVAKATRPRTNYDEKFEEAWQCYPRRDGANPKAPAAKLFLASVKAGADPDQIIAGIRHYAAAEQKNVGTPFIPQMVKWLRDKRWLDYDGTVVPIKFDVRKHLV